MPYNNTPIAPSKDVTGTVSLPLARVKKIIATDPDVSACSNNAAFVITVATEMFLQHLVEQSYNIVKSERKPRRNIQYRDVANAVARVENLEFLADVVPKTMTMKQFKQKQAKEDAGRPASGTNGTSANGQGTLDSHLGAKATEGQAVNGASHEESMEVDNDEEEDTEESGDEVEQPDLAGDEDQSGDEETSKSTEPSKSKPGDDHAMEHS
ncbi:hypothetical protein D0869_03227 [Hortaea werneckii]|uniref:Transcription factor CBF/NF-Y/archaeal histone domain-containing protein n=1 Tax=Hortaea werneckii TaxID=91943 RepID=A0A3M6X6L8_HORWE|nr:hypothetical protein KC334_g230 [Hortaea werneckii]KAI7008236.1 hypothetical protein KC355_g7016 [Hortaea werneckii]KAI7200909.1 hypothetical protein KC324_g2487 [Hortaea werneckii]KAI7593546.1 hypothetical protein KC316_g1671 [Hortaea werneckii]KAI7665407.1 hypothetical protein KC318_g7138 [Hortaea werneckii]